MTIIKGRLRPEGTNNYADVVHLETSADQIVETTDKKVMTAAERTKLNGIAAGAQVNPTAAQLLASLKTVDTDTSGLNANFLQGKTASAFGKVLRTGYYEQTSEITLADNEIYTLTIPLGYALKEVSVYIQSSFYDSYIYGYTGGVLRIAKAINKIVYGRISNRAHLVIASCGQLAEDISNDAGNIFGDYCAVRGANIVGNNLCIYIRGAADMNRAKIKPFTLFWEGAE